MSAWWREWAAASGLSDERSRRGELCLNEAVGNIIQHSSGASRSLTIEVTLEALPESVHVTIADDGGPFNPVEYPKQRVPPERNTGGGLGIEVIRTYATRMRYARQDDRNVLTLTL